MAPCMSVHVRFECAKGARLITFFFFSKFFLRFSKKINYMDAHRKLKLSSCRIVGWREVLKSGTYRS